MLSSPYPEPPIVSWRPAMTLAYLAAVGAGVWALSKPPVSYDIATWVGIAWGLALILGGGLNAFGMIAARYRFEWFGSWLLAFGLATYAVMSWNAALTETPGHGPRALILTGFALVVYSRGAQLSRIDKDAQDRKRREAGGGTDGG